MKRSPINRKISPVTQRGSSFFGSSFFAPAVQAKLSVNTPGDKYEQEADAIANEVVQQKSNTSGTSGSTTTTGAEVGGDGTIATGTETSIASSLGAGQALPETARQEMEQRFQTDFSGVSVHTGSEASQLNRQLNAKAFTVGQDIYFDEGQYAPGSSDGDRLLAHELTHVVQQSGGSNTVQRDPPPWATRVSNAAGMSGAAKDAAYIGLINEALGATPTVHTATNAAANIDAAITAGNYTAWNATSQAVNFDANFNTKVGNTSQYGETLFKNNNGTVTIYIVLGPNAVKSVGPAYTQMANAHEQGHARDFNSQGTSPHAATEAEELVIYTAGFISYFLALSTVDAENCSFNFGEGFGQLFSRYTASAQADRDSSFTNLQTFFTGTIQRNPTNLLKFRIWLQDKMNSRPANDLLVTRMNTTFSLGLTRGTDPITLMEGCQPS